MTEEVKLIRLRKRTWERLKGLGEMGQSFDDLINQLIDKVEKSWKRRDEKWH